MAERTIEELALIELTRNARILQRQLKLIKGMRLSTGEREMVKEMIKNLEKEFSLFKA